MLYDFIKEGWLIWIHFGISITLTITREQDLLQFLGIQLSLFLISAFVKKIFKPIYSTWIGPYLGHSAKPKEMGSWAIVTGATDGIGLAYAKELAREGLNLVLISRTLSRLQNVAEMLESEFKIQTKIIPIDFSKGMENYSVIEKEIAGLDVGTLINNVGMSYSAPSYFHEIENSAQFIPDILNTNILSVTMMTRMVLSKMVEKKKGIVVNVGSASSIATVPLLSLYSSSKAFMENFTLSLCEEYQDKGIIFQYLFPGYVATKMSKIKNSSFFIPSPETFAQMALRTIGLEDQTAVWLPHYVVLEAYKFCRFVWPQQTRNVVKMSMKQLWLYGLKRKIMKSKKLI